MRVAHLNKSRKIGSEIIWVVLGQVLMAAGGLVSVRILTELMSPKSYGELALAMTATFLVNQVLFGPLSQSFLRFFTPAKEKGALSTYLFVGYRLIKIGLLILVTITITTIFGLRVLQYSQWIPIAALALLFSALLGINISFDAVQNAARQRAVVAMHKGIGQWLRILVASLLIVSFGSDSRIAITGYILAAVIILGSQYIFYVRRIATLMGKSRIPTKTEQKPWIDQMTSYAWPFVTWGIIGWLYMASDRWAIAIFRDTRSVGFFAVLYLLGYRPVNLVSDAMGQLIAPIVFGQAGDGTDKARMRNSLKMSNRIAMTFFIFTVLGALLVYFLNDPIFNILVAEEYHSISYLLPWVILASGLFATGQLFALVLLTTLNSKRLILPKTVTCIGGIGFNLLGAYSYGLPGVIVSSMLFSSSYLIWIFVLVLKQQKILSNKP
ncbi:MAG: lipopolysaccharide biosynthesis protein [Proteobacteria bacterium]|nr:lipopolysaccharide biosynthesis protein [Pseudomonadota bacterium]